MDATSDFDAFRWHQWVLPVDLESTTPCPVHPLGEGPKAAAAFIGFACDEGVRRNQGRQGASSGPAAIRVAAANLPCSFAPRFALYDAGDVTCEEGRLEEAQALLGEKVAAILSRGWFPIVLGGGHETAYGHWLGQRSWLAAAAAQGGVAGRSQPSPRRTASLGIVNLDAHFDLRPHPQGGSSGTMFRQVADLLEAEGGDFHYLCLGIQRRSNTMALFRDAGELGARWILARDIAEKGASSAYPALDDFTNSVDRVMLTLCADVLSSAWAPGVSSPQPLGLDPESVLRLIKRVIAGGKTTGFDLCEVSPAFDPSGATASLAATILFAVVNAVAELAGLARE